MFVLTIFSKYIIASLKRKDEESTLNKDCKRFCIHTDSDNEVAEILLSLNHIKQESSSKNDELAEQNKISVESFSQKDTLKSAEVFKMKVNVIENIRLGFFINLVKPPKPILFHIGMKNKIPTNRQEMLERLKQFHMYHYKSTQKLQIFNKKNKKLFNFYIWEGIDLWKLSQDFETKFYFHLSYFYNFFCSYSLNKIFIKSYQNCLLSESNIIKLIEERVYDPNNNIFQLEQDGLEKTTLSQILNIKYQEIQLYVSKFYNIVKPSSKGINRYLYSYVNWIFRTGSINDFGSYLREFLLYSLNDFFSLNEHPSLQFLFPEFKFILFLLNEHGDLCFYKRLHAYAGFFHLKFCFFKKIIEKEIRAAYEKNEKFDVLKCKYFSYFLISSKMLLQPFFYKFFLFHMLEIKKIIFSNLIFFLQLKSKEYRSEINFDTFSLFYFENTNEVIKFFDCSVIRYKNDFDEFPIKIFTVPSLKSISFFINERKCFEKMISQISPVDVNIDFNEENYNYKDFFYRKFKDLLLADFY